MFCRLLVYPLVAAVMLLAASCAITEAVIESCERPVIRVTTTADLHQPCTTESCPLWGAINLANTCNNGMVVELEDTRYTVRHQGGVLALTPRHTIFPSISGRFTIDGNGAVIAREPGTEVARFFTVRGRAELTLRDITLSGGGETDPPGRRFPAMSAGAIRNYARLELDNASFLANRTRRIGGAIVNFGVLIIHGGVHSGNESGGFCVICGGGFLFNGISASALISDATFFNNEALCGGAVLNQGIISVHDSTFRANIGGTEHSADADVCNGGGGLYNLGSEEGSYDAPFANIVGSTFIANTAWQGAALFNNGPAVMRLRNSTVSGNRRVCRDCEILWPHSAVGIASSGQLTIDSTTVVDNLCGDDDTNCTGGVLSFGSRAQARISNSIVAVNGGLNCRARLGGVITAIGVNLDSDSSCRRFSLHADPNLEVLRDNRGPTPTHAVRPGSPSHNAGGIGCPLVDQRREPRARTVEDPCDVGSFEL